MNFIKRALLSVKERKGKSFLQIFIFSAIFALVLSGLAIQSAAKKSSELAREAVGADVTLQPDRQNEGGMLIGVPIPEAEKIASLDYIKGYNFTLDLIARADDFETISTDEETAGQNGTDEPGLRIRGVSNSDLSEFFMNEDATLEEGEPITEEHMDKNVAMIEQNLAELNNLEVGDTLTIGHVVEDMDMHLEVEIIGIYSTTETLDAGLIDYLPSRFQPSNQIYVPYTVATPFNLWGDENEEEKAEVETMIHSVVYYLQNPSQLDEFLEEAKAISSLNFDGEYMLSAHDQAYQNMIGPIENVASITNNVVYLVAIAGASILGLIVMMTIRERKYEMGVLLALGERKWKLIGQFVAEFLLVAILALGIASVSGPMIAGAIGDQLLEQQLTQEQELIAADRANNKFFDPEANFEAIDELQINISPQDFGLMAVIGMMIALISTLIPSLSVLRLQPKTILTKQE